MSNITKQKVKITTACPLCSWGGISSHDNYCGMCKTLLDDLKYTCTNCGIKFLIHDDECNYCHSCGHPINMEII